MGGACGSGGVSSRQRKDIAAGRSSWERIRGHYGGALAWLQYSDVTHTTRKLLQARYFNYYMPDTPTSHTRHSYRPDTATIRPTDPTLLLLHPDTPAVRDPTLRLLQARHSKYYMPDTPTSHAPLSDYYRPDTLTITHSTPWLLENPTRQPKPPLTDSLPARHLAWRPCAWGLSF